MLQKAQSEVVCSRDVSPSGYVAVSLFRASVVLFSEQNDHSLHNLNETSVRLGVWLWLVAIGGMFVIGITHWWYTRQGSPKRTLGPGVAPWAGGGAS